VENEPKHMSPEFFREQAVRAVEAVAAYMRRVETLPAGLRSEPGDVLNHIPETASESPGDAEEWSRIFGDLERFIVPNMVHWQSPSFFGFFPCNSTGPAVIGELFSAGFGQQGMLWATSPAASELERALLDQMGRAMGLPETFLSTSDAGGGCIQSTASDATLVAMVAGRRRVSDRGADFHRTTVYASRETHSSFLKAALIAGLAARTDDRSRVRLIETDSHQRLDPKKLAEAVRADLAAGLAPAMVCATLGTTGTTAIDPLAEIASVLRETGAAERGCWLHVDAAHAGALLVCPEHRAMAAGLEHADSLCFNPHKWLLVNFDCDLFWTRDRRSLTASLSVTPEYLRNAASDSGAVFDYRDWGIPLGRRFRALKLWFVLRHYGLSGLRAHVREGVRLAEAFEALVRADDRFEMLAERSMNLVCLAHRAGDAATRRLMDTVNAEGPAFLTHTSVPTPAGPRLAIRVAIGAVTTKEAHVRAIFEQMQRLADDAVRSG